jgi:hypothetical protein
MKETYKDEFNYLQRIFAALTGMWRINRDSIDFKWGYFAPRFGLKFVVHRGGYFDQRFAVSFCILWGCIHVYLPFKTKLSEGCDMPRYGFDIHGNAIWIYKGGDFDESWGQVTSNAWWTWDLPWFTFNHIGHFLMRKDGSWRRVEKSEFSHDIIENDESILVEKHDYLYERINGEVQKRIATCNVEKRVWSRKWFPFVKMVKKTMNVNFSDEVGEQSGSWKGGVIGTGHDMLPNENVAQCVNRMQSERKFK